MYLPWPGLLLWSFDKCDMSQTQLRDVDGVLVGLLGASNSKNMSELDMDMAESRRKQLRQQELELPHTHFLAEFVQRQSCPKMQWAYIHCLPRL